jgi:hypothetical protein
VLYFDEGKDTIFLRYEFHDETFQPSFTLLSHYSTKDAARKHVPCLKFSPRQTFFLELKGRLNALRRSFISRSFNFSLRSCQSSSRFLFIPSWTSGNDEVLGIQPPNSLSQPLESSTFHDPFQRWIEHFSRNVTWHDLVPPSHLHELDFTISYDIMHALTHVIFVLTYHCFGL